MAQVASEGEQDSPAVSAGQTARGNEPASLRGNAYFLAAVSVVLGLATAFGAGWLSWQRQEAELVANLRATARAIALSIDREIGDAIDLANVLATSPSLASNDLKGFYAQAVAAVQPHGWSLVLHPADSGMQLINTQAAFGRSARFDNEGEWLADVAATRAPTVKGLMRSSVDGSWLSIVQIPVFRDGALANVIGINIPARRFQAILDAQALPSGALISILDQSRRIVAHVPDSNAYLGRLTSAPVDPRHDEELINTVSQEGIPIASFRGISPRFGWAVGIGIPKAQVMASFLGPAALAFGTGMLLTAVAFAMLLMFAGRLLRAIAPLTGAAETLGQGRVPAVPRLPYREFEAIARAMTLAGQQLELRSTERDRTEEQLRQLNAELEQRVADRTQRLLRAQRLEAVGQLTGGVAHDFNNLLTAVLGSLELIERRADAAVRKYVATARRATERGAQLTSSLLAFARRQQLRSETVNLNQLVRDFLPLAQRTLAAAVRIEVHLHEIAGPLYCRADAAHLESALLNLVLNAQDAVLTCGGGTISISTFETELDAAALADNADAAPGRFHAVSVLDTGPGIPSAVIDKVFEPFFTTKGPGHGSGLGLSQVYGFARQSAGHITLLNRTGAGAEATIYLPAAVAATEPAPTFDADPAEVVSLQSSTILVADDDSDVLEVVSDGLRASGFRVLSAASVAKARAIIEAEAAVDVLITDVVMVDGNGIDLARASLARRSGLRVLLCSGYASASLARHGVKPGEFEIIVKPFRTADLIERINRLLHSKHAQGA